MNQVSHIRCYTVLDLRFLALVRSLLLLLILGLTMTLLRSRATLDVAMLEKIPHFDR